MPPDHSEGLLGKRQRYSLDGIWLSQCTWRPESERRAQKLYKLCDGASGSPFLPLRRGIGRLCSTPVSVEWEKSLSHTREKKPVHCSRNWAEAPLGLKSEKVLIVQSCLTLCNPMDCSPPASSVHRILQARILEWGSRSLLQGIFLTQESNPNLLRLLTWQVDSLPLSHLGSQHYTAQNGETLSWERVQRENVKRMKTNFWALCILTCMENVSEVPWKCFSTTVPTLCAAWNKSVTSSGLMSRKRSTGRRGHTSTSAVRSVKVHSACFRERFRQEVYTHSTESGPGPELTKAKGWKNKCLPTTEL